MFTRKFGVVIYCLVLFWIFRKRVTPKYLETIVIERLTKATHRTSSFTLISDVKPLGKNCRKSTAYSCRIFSFRQLTCDKKKKKVEDRITYSRKCNQNKMHVEDMRMRGHQEAPTVQELRDKKMRVRGYR